MKSSTAVTNDARRPWEAGERYMAAQGQKGGGWRKCCKIQRVAVKDARLGGGTYIHRVGAGLRRKTYAIALAVEVVGKSDESLD